MNNERSHLYPFLGYLKQGIWLLGISSWLFGIVDRGIASFADGYLSAIDIAQLFTAAFFFVSWLFLKPSQRLQPSVIAPEGNAGTDPAGFAERPDLERWIAEQE